LAQYLSTDFSGNMSMDSAFFLAWETVDLSTQTFTLPKIHRTIMLPFNEKMLRST
jgi:hypothetical protein